MVSTTPAPVHALMSASTRPLSPVLRICRKAFILVIKAIIPLTRVSGSQINVLKGIGTRPKQNESTVRIAAIKLMMAIVFVGGDWNVSSMISFIILCRTSHKLMSLRAAALAFGGVAISF